MNSDDDVWSSMSGYDLPASLSMRACEHQRTEETAASFSVWSTGGCCGRRGTPGCDTVNWSPEGAGGNLLFVLHFLVLLCCESTHGHTLMLCWAAENSSTEKARVHVNREDTILNLLTSGFKNIFHRGHIWAWAVSHFKSSLNQHLQLWYRINQWKRPGTNSP